MRITAKKRFGQHFLRDRGVLDRLVRLVAPMPEDVILEIGAGDGALSTRLAAAARKLLAVELDIECLPVLERSLASFPSACIVAGDILTLDMQELLCDQVRPELRLRVAGNLPYNIATAIIQRLLRLPLPFADMIFMVQLEVAERITARPASRQYGLLSIICQHLAEARIAFKVSPACFVPRPNVMSAVLELHPLKTRRDPEIEDCFVEIARAAFTHRRKTLANSLRRHGDLGPGSASLLAEAGIDGSRRPEDLAVKEYEHLAATLCKRLRSRQ